MGFRDIRQKVRIFLLWTIIVVSVLCAIVLCIKTTVTGFSNLITNDPSTPATNEVNKIILITDARTSGVEDLLVTVSLDGEDPLLLAKCDSISEAETISFDLPDLEGGTASVRVSFSLTGGEDLHFSDDVLIVSPILLEDGLLLHFQDANGIAFSVVNGEREREYSREGNRWKLSTQTAHRLFRRDFCGNFQTLLTQI